MVKMVKSSRKFLLMWVILIGIHLFIYFRSLLTVNATQLVDITVLAMSRQENVCALPDTLEIHVKKES